jgi:hypothetical protein
MNRCPQCGGVLDLIVDSAVGAFVIPAFAVRGGVELRIAPAAFVACTACEFCARVGETMAARKDEHDGD